MKPLVSVLALLWVLSAGCLSVMAQASNSTADIEQLKLILSQQQKALEQQQAQIRALQSALAEQQKMLVDVVQGRASVSALVPAVYRKSDDNLQAQSEPTPVPGEQQSLTPQQERVEQELQRGPEIADVTPTTPALELGPAKVRLLGYPALTMLWRSVNNGGNVATNFGNIPFDNTVAGTTSEFRVSPQTSRLGVRVDADLKSSTVAGYFEMDFIGAPVGGNLVTQSGYPFRIRQAWFDWSKGNWEITGGQL
jgi:hypothetical protein